MKGILIFILFFFISAEIKAQLGISSLNITLSDIQSVKIIELPAQSKAEFPKKNQGKSKVQILNPSASQIRQIDSQVENSQLNSQNKGNSKQLESPKQTVSKSGFVSEIASLNKQSARSIPLIVYQIDPR